MQTSNKMISFDKYEKAISLLESHAPCEVSEELLEHHGLTVAELEHVNEGLLKNLFGGWFSKIKDKLTNAVSGGVLKQIDGILSDYEKAKTDLMRKTLKEKEKIFKAETAISKGEDEKRNGQIIERARMAISAIEKANKAKMESFDAKLENIAKGKDEKVTDYIDLKIAEVKEKIADAELKEIEKFATEEQVDKAEQELEKSRKKRLQLQQDLEKALAKTTGSLADRVKKGEKWFYKNNAGKEVEVEIADAPDSVTKGETMVKGKKGTFSVKTDRLVRQVDESSLLGFDSFERLYESVQVDVINEGVFDKYLSQLSRDNKDLVKLGSLMKEYQKAMKDASSKRVKVKIDLSKESDDAKKEKLNNDLVKVNNDEAKQIEQVEKKLADFIEGKDAKTNHLMRSIIEEIKLTVSQDERKQMDKIMSDAEKDRMDDIIKNKQEAIKARAKKMDKMIKDDKVDTSAEDKEIEKQEREEDSAEVDYDADGKVEPEEKIAQKQMQQRSEKSPLNKK